MKKNKSNSNNNVSIIPIISYCNVYVNKSFVFRENIKKSGVSR